MKISLIIPAFNEEKRIGDCLDAALRSGGGMLREIIVVDNASTDRTAAEAAKRAGVRVVREDAKGVQHARQRGFREATGDILAYLDADTRMPAGWCEHVLGEFARDPNLACISGPYVYYDIPRWQQFLVRIYWYLAMPLYFVIGYMAVLGNLAIRRDVLEKMGGFDTSIDFYGDDTDTSRRAKQFGAMKFMPGLVMETSGRRLSGQGLLKTAFTYALNFFSGAFLHRPATITHEDIR